ncbi:Wzz/FepE/Etk N-terminal domain-containing protein [Mesorhizobium sp. GR13]|uniref:GumC family protein n=1 Tax=Mesorhizobium sp. GR13 TaxID=2562308 RepID=UPI0010C0021C|nr:Wzz/FepE/Etk N-terminal domain-containing protein [Mesorhizobium sp. GR13]
MPGFQNTADNADIDLGRLFASLGRHWFRILLGALLFVAAAFLFTWTATPLYRGETRLLIEARESVFTRPDASGENERPLLDEEGVTSQVEVILSADNLRRTADKLNLAAEPEFGAIGDVGPVKQFLILTGLVTDPSQLPVDERVMKTLRENLSVYRVEKSRVIVVEFTSSNPKLAASVPNALADEFVAASQAAKSASNVDATDWLAPEIADLTKRVKDAEAKVAEYRARNGLIVGQNDTVLSTTQLSELSSELSRVRANRATAEANLESVRKALDSGSTLDALPEIVASPLIQNLRDRLAQTRAQIADLSITLLPNHPRIRSLNAQIANLERQIRAEAGNVLKGLTNTVDTERAREQQLVADLNRLKVESGRAGEQEVDLRALEREAAAQRDLLQSYMTRYREASSRQDRNYVPADARIFSRATVPSEPYYPKKLPIIGASFGAGLLAMSILTLLGELFSGRATVPAGGARLEPAREPELIEAIAPPSEPLAVPMRPVAVEMQTNERETGVAGAARKLVELGSGRALFVSPEGDEAAASSVLVAREIADAGVRVLLIDLTSSGVAGRPMLDSSALPGITNLLAATAQFTDVIHMDLYSDAHVIPSGTVDAEIAMRGIDRLPMILDALDSAYAIVVVECGPARAESIRRLVGNGCQLFVSVIDRADDLVEQATKALEAEGYKDLTIVTPVGHVSPPTVPGRNAA